MDLNIKLLPKHHRFFAKEGYLILEDVLNTVNSKKLQIWAQEVHDLPRTSEVLWIPYEEINASGQRVLCRTENFVDFHEGFNKLIRSPQILHFLEHLTGEPMVLFKDKLNYKFAGSGGFSPHIDSTGKRTINYLSILVAIDDTNLQNGCLEFVPGSHKEAIPIGPDNCILPEWVQQQTWAPIELKAGQFVIFGSHLAHRSGTNKSSQDRKALYATYNWAKEGDLRQEYYEERAKLYPATHLRKEGEDYSQGEKIFGFGSPMLSLGLGRQREV